MKGLGPKVRVKALASSQWNTLAGSMIYGQWAALCLACSSDVMREVGGQCWGHSALISVLLLGDLLMRRGHLDILLFQPQSSPRLSS